MKHKIWAAGAALTIAAMSLPYGAAFAADEAAPAMTAQVTKATSSSRQTSSEVTVEGTWAAQKLTVGQSFTVGSIDGGFQWKADFPSLLDDGSRIGDCKATEATLTCTVTEVPSAYADKENVTGTFHARAQLTDRAVGTEKTSITLNGETVRTLVWGDRDGTGTCTNDCGGSATRTVTARSGGASSGRSTPGSSTRSSTKPTRCTLQSSAAPARHGHLTRRPGLTASSTTRSTRSFSPRRPAPSCA